MSETCDNCFARDRDSLIRPSAEDMVRRLVDQAVKNMRELPGHGLSGEDSGLADVFEEWADQVSGEHSVMFRLYEDLAEQTCESIVANRSPLEIAVIAAYSDGFTDYSCTEDFIDSRSIVGFDARAAASQQLFKEFEAYALLSLIHN